MLFVVVVVVVSRDRADFVMTNSGQRGTFNPSSYVLQTFISKESS